MANRQFWSGRRVVVTGHTGFKGTWLAAWLAELGAQVTGIALPPATEPSLFAASGLASRIDSRFADVRCRELLDRHLRAAQPDIVFHLAAQPLVLAGLEDPVTTFQTNVLGVVNLLDAARRLPGLRAVVVITSDKCYLRPDRRCAEGDELGGHDPYSASKACAEMVVHAYRCSWFSPDGGIGLATVRAGNVIGGGDFSPGRLLPDLVRAFMAGRPAELRHPGGIRPWQHVLDALAGYLTLAEKLAVNPASFSTAWNFGPDEEAGWTAARIADVAAARFGAGSWRAGARELAIEVPTLLLSSDQAKRWLGWRPRLATQEAVEWTIDGYRRLLGEGDAGWLVEQIRAYAADDRVPRPSGTIALPRPERRHAYA
jgi:CDP-glucose 4,6-dehydratase